ncbi:MAG: hypothetical protein O7C67_06205 [Gammaproteobacteria bacterium]|nr:hypothetical protein [Gammaproteobacteria bacterium]
MMTELISNTALAGSLDLELSSDGEWSKDSWGETEEVGRRSEVYGLPLSQKDVENFHRELDLIKEMRTDMTAAGLREFTMPLMQRVF